MTDHDDHEQAATQGTVQTDKKQSSGCAKIFLIGCGGLLFIAAALVLVGYMYWTSFLTMGVRSISDNVINESAIEEPIKEHLRTQRDRLLAKFEDETMTAESLYEKAAAIEDTALIPAYVALIFAADILPKSGLTDIQKADLQVQMNRMLRACVENGIKGSEVGNLVAPIFSVDSEAAPSDTAISFESGQIPESVSDEELLELTRTLKERADELSITSTHFDFDTNAALELFVDDILGETSP